MAYVIVGNRFHQLGPSEKQILFLRFLVDPDVACSSDGERDFHRWLAEQVAAGSSLGDIARALVRREPRFELAEAWSRVDDYVGRLIERGLARAFRVVDVY